MTSLLRSSILLTGQTICYRKLAKPLPPGLADGDCSSPDSVVELIDLCDKSNDTQCKICLGSLELGSGMTVKLKSCGHKYHLQCIRDAMKYQCSMKCPECRNSILAITSPHDQLKYLRGDSPVGTMHVQLHGSSCAGYENYGSIIITYRMETKYNSRRVAYLPNTPEGNELLIRLASAFSCGLIFTIGISLTSGLDNVTTWGSIHHKTSQTGGLVSHGFPDDQYISNCNNELDSAGIPPFDVCAAYIQTNHIQTSHTPSQLHRYVKPSLQSPRQSTLFFYQEKVKSVFTENMSGGCLPDIHEQIQSESFVKFVEVSHIKGPRITINTRIFQSSIYQAFVEECKTCAESTEKEYNVQIVFHGTARSNIESILSNGLDPSLRRGQSYGQGEYFAASPDLPLNYCRGGTKMLVFLVITTKFDLRGPQDIVVVEKTQRQLPIATLSFLSYDPRALTAARTFQANVSKLVAEVREKEKAVKVATAKEKIIKLILQEEYFAASDIYEMSCEKGQPPEVWADEMAAYVRDHIRDEEMVEIYFPNLPKRPKSSQDLKIRATTDIEEEAATARKNLASVTAAKGNNMPIPPQQRQSWRSISAKSRLKSQRLYASKSTGPKSTRSLKIQAPTDIEEEAASARKKLASVSTASKTSSNDNENGNDAAAHQRFLSW